MTTTTRATTVPAGWAASMALYLLGIFMGAIDTGIITPARPIVARDLGVDESSGIWMITIYTLAYAAAIPVMGKLADRQGRKRVYLASIAVFGVGSLLCGLSQDLGSFPMLIAARALQAVGGGGILPIATAEIGTEVPEEKRGMALGLVGAVYGIANIFGASVGSLILDVVGSQNWQWIFYVNVPIAIAIVVAGWRLLPDHRPGAVKPIDGLGTVLLVGIILSLLYGIRNLDFFDPVSSLQDPAVWPFLVGCLVALPLFVLAERRAADPVLNLRYFTDRGIALTLALSLLSGVVLMAVVFVPQLAENALGMASGKGGYFVIVLGLASGVGAPLSGRLTDRFGPKAVLGLGMALSAVAAASVVWWLIPHPSLTSVLVALGLIGLGLGFVVGSPLNYMMLERTTKAESASALGTLSLVRSLGTTLAPAIMVGFIANGAAGLQDSLTAELPDRVAVPTLPHAVELTDRIARWKADENLADELAGVDIPDLTRSEVTFDTDGGGSLPDDLVELLRTADVTTITDRTKVVAERLFSDNTPTTIADIQGGVDAGIAGLRTGLDETGSARQEMSDGLGEMDTGLADMATGLAEMDAQVAKMGAALRQMDAGASGMATGIAGMDAPLAEMRAGLSGMDEGLAGLDAGVAGVQQPVTALDLAIAGMDAGIAKQRAALAGLEAAAAAPAPTTPPTTAPTAAPTTAPTAATARTAPDAAADCAEPSSGGTTPPPASTPPASTPPASTPPPGGGDVAGQLAALRSSIATLQTQRDAAASERATLAAQLAGLQQQRGTLATQRAELEQGRAALQAQRDKLAGDRAALLAQRAKLAAGRAALQEQREKLADGRASLEVARAELADARAQLDATRAELTLSVEQLGELRDAVPGVFDQALADYLVEIDRRAPRLQATFSAGLGSGFRGVYLFDLVVCLLALGVILLVPRGRRSDS